MSSLFSLHKTMHPVTAVESSIYCEFLGYGGKQLVVIGANVFKVYRLVPDKDSLYATSHGSHPKMRLECVFSSSLHGRAECMLPVRFPGSPRDALMFAFADAKLSICEYDPLRHDLSIVSMHCYEDDGVRSGVLQSPPPMVRVDPENRCAAMLVFGLRIAILPFRREVSYEEETGARRSPVMASYVVNLSDLDTHICNVIDMQFLFGYYEPTLAILFEPLRTYSGRLAVRRDTCHFVAVSLNVAQRVHPVIWTVTQLPFDCLRVVPVPRPIGGTLLFAVNAILYLNQSVPTYGLSLNSSTDSSTRFPLKTPDGVKMTLDCAHSTFISCDQLVLSLKSGELYVATIVADSMRTVRNISLERSASSVLTSCMTLCDDLYLFLGSRLGNSLLLRVQEKNANKDGEPPGKKRRLDFLLGNREKLDLEELEVYGSEDMTQAAIKQYSFEVCDSILNLSPCGQLVMGQPPFLSEEFSTLADPDIELVATSGHGKNGALSVLQRSIRPQVVTTFALPGCLDMWTVVGEKTGGATSDQRAPEHAFLLLSQPDATMVLQTGEAINELDHSGFDTVCRTVAAGNLADHKYIVQVTGSRVLLLSGSTLVHALDVSLGGGTVAASIADPYVLVYSELGEVALVTLVGSRLRLSVPSLSTAELVLASAFVDTSGMFSTDVPYHVQNESQRLESRQAAAPPSQTHTKRPEMDDEDEMLYGDSSTVEAPASTDRTVPVGRASVADSWRRWRQKRPRSHWALLAYRSGDVALVTLPDFIPAMQLNGLGQGATVLGDQTAAESVDDDLQTVDEVPSPLIRELHISCLGHMESRPLLTALVDEQLFIYEAFPCYSAAGLKLRFRRVSHDLLIKTKKSKMRSNATADAGPGSVVTCQLREFSNISGFRGLFLCGANPHWILMTSRGELRFHPMSIDGRVHCFTSFNNVNCPQGFLYFNRQDELRISVLPSHLLYDSPWPVRKVALRRTPHFVTYHMETKTYLVCTSHAQPSMKVYKFTGDDKELSVEDRGDRFPYPLQKTYSIQLYSPVSWEPVPNATVELEEWETVACMKNVSLSYEGHRSGQRMYVAACTNYSYGEDVVCHGKVILLDVIEVVPEPGQPLTKYKLKVLLEKEQSAPVTAVGCVNGYLLGAVGQKLYVWMLKDGDLVGLAFIDTQMYIHQLQSMKNLILVGDIWNSVCVLRFQSDFRTLSVIGRDFKRRDVYSVEFMVDNTQVGFITTDSEANLLVFVYQPESRESSGGGRLVRRSDFQLCSRVHTMSRIRCRLMDTSGEKKHPPIVAKRHISFYANLDGGLGFLLPIPEKTYRRLMMLQNLMVGHCRHALGLNPRTFRAYSSRRRETATPARGVLDGDLLYQYCSLPAGEQRQMARRVGTRPDEILDDLTQVSRYTAHF